MLGKNSFTKGVVQALEWLPSAVVESLTLEIFKSHVGMGPGDMA